MVIKYKKEIRITVTDFRKHGLLAIAQTKEPVDVMLVSDNFTIFALKKDDIIVIKRSPQLVKFVELEKNYFFKSLQEKFAFE